MAHTRRSAQRAHNRRQRVHAHAAMLNGPADVDLARFPRFVRRPVGGPEPRGGVRSRSVITTGSPCVDGESRGLLDPLPNSTLWSSDSTGGTIPTGAPGQRVRQRRRLLRWMVTMPATMRRAGSTSPHSNQPFILSNPSCSRSCTTRTAAVTSLRRSCSADEDSSHPCRMTSWVLTS